MGGSTFFARLLVVAFLLMVAGIMVTAAVLHSRPPSEKIEITITQIDAVQFRIAWQSRRRRDALIFEALPDNYRGRRWHIETPGFEITNDKKAARLVRVDGKPFSDAEIIMTADGVRLPKEYQPVAAYGAGGALVYTGHFHPLNEEGGRVDASFNFVAAKGGEVVAFGSRAKALADWQSPLNHPAFIYYGPLRPIETDHVFALIDPAAPRWIANEFGRLTPRAFDYFASAFGPRSDAGAATKSNLFLAARLGGDQGRLSYAGDALPGQFQITLEGGAWEERSVRGEDIFRRSTLHEAFHLWQTAAAPPGADENAGWIHEGGADAVAVDAMLALGFWNIDELAAFGAAARDDCAAGLNAGSLSSAHARGAFPALYACGYLIAEAVVRADGSTATAFWRDFMKTAAAEGGYSEPLFFDFVAARTGDADFARAVKYFVQTPHADPSREIDRMLAAASRGL